MKKKLLKTIFANFQGDWSFTRNFSTGDYVSGTACFKMIETDLLHYLEHGLLTHHRGEFTIYQDYFYYWDGMENEIKVYFSSNGKPGNLFHTLVFQSAEAENQVAVGHHLCKADYYKAIYQFISKHVFDLSYQVKGPAKDYVSITKYFKQ